MLSIVSISLALPSQAGCVGCVGWATQPVASDRSLDTHPVTAVADQPGAAPCKEVCGGLSEAWDTKCTWSFKCSGCAECVVLSPGSAAIRKAARTGASLSTENGANEDAPPCLSMCEGNQDPWSNKCKWPTKCAGCEKCVGYMYAAKDGARLAAKAAAPCKPACHSQTHGWGTKCKWPTMCSGCSSCAHEGWWSQKTPA